MHEKYLRFPKIFTVREALCGFMQKILFFFFSHLLPFQTKNTHKPPSKLHFKPIRSRGSHQESSQQVLIVVLTADIRQISIKKSSSIELYLVNPCGAEQESLIVLLADNPFAGRIASPLDNGDDSVRMHFT
ncbi:hypothetical protein E3N88_05682 [Mikania micrantha]|uniref:Uncharacterized protein n=1 Tax=Mikania micrantha TaxID=192012 RepID=A0A5N6PMB9_9ASTR|nr:hypothetical protein E3N88_05682 [Mikania micrantha]